MKQLEQIEIGRYQIQSHLARGGMADIYLAYDNEMDRTVAIKMVHESAGEYCERFQHEVKVMAGLAHEHILPAFDYGEYQSWYFLVTPYIEYGTLNSRLAAGPLTLEEADLILAQLAGALQFAHDQGIVHRDVKPSNVLMRDGNHVYLADFGLVKRVGQENGLTVTGYLIGTPEYMAPELAEEDATPQSDVYALGVLLYQMLAGRVPFKANTPMGVFLRHIRDLPELPTTFNAAIPLEVEKVILRAIEKDPHRRYQSARELYQAYRQAVEKVACEGVMDQSTLVVANQLATARTVNIKVVRQNERVSQPVLVAMCVVLFCLAFFFILVSSAFSSAGQDTTIHAANAQGTKSRSTPASALNGVMPGSPINPAASKHPTAGATATASAPGLNAAPGYITQQSSKNANASTSYDGGKSSEKSHGHGGGGGSGGGNGNGGGNGD